MEFPKLGNIGSNRNSDFSDKDEKMKFIRKTVNRSGEMHWCIVLTPIGLSGDLTSLLGSNPLTLHAPLN